MTHPECCTNPHDCTLSYREHLTGFGIGVDAVPSRAVTRTPGQPDEPCTTTRQRETTWAADHDAYRQLRRAGIRPESIQGSADRVKGLGG
ncbi:MAG: hypothetical protein GWN07_02305 [Actinobacteria bacterium]|nr:hypothetical protein [Actinomycetota bacterium]NIS28908.1 hypothetical protein [Actinomycetota bacterium]NIU64341.1 hypothetical protein [Actinomycetota bacterium]NIX18731.1 hypothetical protein [Actinomycetota bacterium]